MDKHTGVTISIFANTQKYFILFGSVSLLTYFTLAYYSSLSPSINITTFIGIIVFAFISYSGATFICFNKNIQPSISLIILFAISFHLIGIFADPQFEDDYFRYLWDGYIFFEYGNPYTYAPSEYFANESIPAQYQNLLNQINYPDIKTIYGPLLQYSFWISHYFYPADIIGPKIIVSLCNLGIILLLSKMLDTRYVLLYAWNPLLIKEIAFTAHPDVIGVLFLMMTVLFISTRPKTAAFVLGVSVCSKPFAWLIALYFLSRFTRFQWLIFLSTIFLLYLPFILNEGLFSGLSAFGNTWEFNAGIYALFTVFLPPLFAKGLVGILLLLMLLYCYHLFSQGNFREIRGDIIIGSLLLLSPVLNPWYLVWLLPFAALHSQLWPWIASFALLLSYFSGINLSSNSLQAYELATWVKPVEYSLIFLAIAYDVKKNLTRKKLQQSNRKRKTSSPHEKDMRKEY